MGTASAAAAFMMATEATPSLAKAAGAAVAVAPSTSTSSSLASALVPLHFYAAALGADDLLLFLIQKLLAPLRVKATADSTPQPTAPSSNSLATATTGLPPLP